MEIKDLFLAYLGKTLNIPAEELTETLFTKSDDGEVKLADNALTLLEEMNQKHIDSLKTRGKEQFDNGYKKAQAEIAKQWEGKLKKSFGVDSDKVGDDLINDILTTIESKTELDEFKVKRHRLFRELETRTAQQIEEQKAAYEAQLADVNRQYKRKEVLTKVSDIARREFLALNPALPEDPAKRENQIGFFLKNFEGFDYDLESEDPIVWEGEKRKEDAHGHAYTLKRLVKETAEPLFEFKKQDPKGSAANKNEPGSGGGSKSEADTWEAYMQARTAPKQ